MKNQFSSSFTDTANRSFLKRLWQDYQWLALGILWLVFLGLGTIGFARYAAAYSPGLTFWDHFYRALQLIPFNSGAVEGEVSWELEVARFFIPVLTAATAVKALAALFQNQIQMARLNRMRGHILICGLSKKGIRLVRGFRALGEKVVVLERSESNAFLAASRSAGAVVLLGDATDPINLQKAGIQRARLLISVTDEDGTNAKVALQAQQLCTARGSTPLTCMIHIVDPQMCTLLREREINDCSGAGFRLEFFNVFEHAARLLLRQYPPFNNGGSTGCPAHMVVVGLGKMGESLVIQAGRQWHAQMQQANSPRLKVSIIDLEAVDKTETLRIRYPRLASILDLEALQMNVRSAAFARGDYLFDRDRNCSACAIFINLDDDALGLKAGLLIKQRLRGLKIPVVIRMVEESGLAALLNHGDTANGFDNLHEFNLLDQTCTPELVQGGTHEVLARALHEEYLRSQLEAGQDYKTNPLLVPWEQLPAEYRESNYRQADHIGVKLKAVGRGIAPLTDFTVNENEFSNEEVEYLAQIEHERWCEELRQAGWTYAKGQKDKTARTHPALLPWADLPESEKAKNRGFVRQMPVFLARAGLQIYRQD